MMPDPMRVARDSAVQAKAFAPADCPRCASDRIWPELVADEPFGLECCDCGWVGPREGFDDNPDAAIMAWNDEAAKVATARKLNLNLHFDQPIRKVRRP